MDSLIAPIAEELNRALGVDVDTLKKELEKLIVEFKVPAEEARRAVARKYRKNGWVPRRELLKSVAAMQQGLEVPAESGTYKPVSELRNGDTGITIVAAVKEPKYHEIQGPDGPVSVIEGVLEDNTGKVYFTSWVDVPDIFSVKSIVARNVYVKSFKGIPGVNITETTTLEEFNGEPFSYARERQPIARLLATDGAFDIEVEGDIVSIRPGSGLIERCPACGRVMQKGNCRAHGKVDGQWDMRIKAVLDDGTGSVICVFGSGLTGTLLGVTIEEMLNCGETPEKIEELIKKAMIGLPVIVAGDATKGDYGMILVAASCRKADDDIGSMARQLLGEIR